MHTLTFNIPEYDFKIKHSDKLLFLGSCFSDDISKQFHNNGFNARSNPFGTIFHPSVIARFIKETILNTAQERLFAREDVYLSWDAGAKHYGMSSKELFDDLQSVREEWRVLLKNADYLFITFGTSHGYFHKEMELVVGNCHKMPSTIFEKILTDSAHLRKEWEEILILLKEYNPSLKLVFTVSPVRHAKDGLIENNLSKAILIQLVHELVKRENSFYFPSYEIVIDELRDYRYFKEDLVHPNELAIQYIWESLSKILLDAQTISIAKTYASIKLAEEHLIVHPESKESKRFNEQLLNRKNEFLRNHPTLKF